MAHSIRDTQSFLGNIAFPPALPLPGLPASRVLGLESQGAITLAVSTTGLDVDPTRPARIVSGDWALKPFATVQAALDSLPGRVISTHTVQINVGAGTFPGFAVKDIILQGTEFVSLTIAGTRTAATLATGPATGTATGGSERTLTLAGAGWTIDDLVGRFVSITAGPGAGQIMLVAANTADTVTLSEIGSPAFAATSVFSVEDLATVFNTGSAVFGFTIGVLRVLGGNVQLRDLLAAGPGSGALCYQSSDVSFHRVVCRYVSGGNNGFLAALSGSVDFWASGSVGAYAVGASFQTMKQVLGLPFVRGASYGLSFNNTQGWVFCYWGAYIRDCAADALGAERTPLWIRYLTIDGCGGSAILAKWCPLDLVYSEIKNAASVFALIAASARISGSLSGTGNTGFGLNAKGVGNTIELVGSTPTITGTLGEVTVDGMTAETWASLSNPGDYVLDQATGARVSRQ